MVRGLLSLVLLGCSTSPMTVDAWPPFDAPAQLDAVATLDLGEPVDAFRPIDIGPDVSDTEPPPPFDVGTDAAAVCEVVPQSGCGSDACRLGAEHAACGPISDQPAEYAPCTHTTSCAAGMQCLGGDVHTLCRRLCRGGVTDCGTGRACIQPTSMQVGADGAFVTLPAGVGLCGSP